MTAADLAASLQLSAQPHYSGAIELAWELPAGAEDTGIRIIRRRRRHPASPATWAPQPAMPDRLTDGWQIYESEAWSADYTTSGPVDWQDGQGTQTLVDYLAEGDPNNPRLVPVRRRVHVYALSPQTGNPYQVKTITYLLDADGREQPGDAARPLQGGERYYYTAFVGPDALYCSRTQAGALATVPFRLGQQLYNLLPTAYQRYDTVLPDPNQAAPEDLTSGQLRRFIATIGGEMDVIRTLAEGLRRLHDPDQIPAHLLPRLAEMIGWNLSRFLDEEVQRREIGLAPAIFRTTGTMATIAALVNLYTGWRAEVRELSRNVLVTFDRKAVERRQGKPNYYHGRLGRSLVLGPHMDPDLPTQVSNRPLDDPNSYTYEMYRDGGPPARYAMEAVGVWLYPNREDQDLLLRREEQLRDALTRFLPNHVRVLIFLEPSIAEETYDTVSQVAEVSADAVLTADMEPYTGPDDLSYSAVAGWVTIRSNRSGDRSIKIAVVNGSTTVMNRDRRTWHAALGHWN